MSDQEMPPYSLRGPLTRRGFLAGAMVAAFAVACGGGDDDAEDGTPTAAAASSSTSGATSSATATPKTRTIKDVYGASIEIPFEPKRVVAADNLTMPWVLELGIVPVAGGSTGVSALWDNKDFAPELYALGADKVKVISRNEPDYELVTTLQPDLILISKFAMEGRVKEKGEGYKKIAPTLVIPDSSGGIGPIEQFRYVGDALNRNDKADKIIADFEAKTKTYAGSVKVKTISIVLPSTEGNFYFYTDADVISKTLATLLGVKITPEASTVTYTTPVSGERLREATGEALILLQSPGYNFDNNPLYRLLPSVQAGKVLTDGGLYTTWSGNAGIGALQTQFQHIAEFLTKA